MEKKKCKIDGCENNSWGLGFCSMHYFRQRNGITDMRPGKLPRIGGRRKDNDPFLRKNKDLNCKVDGCKEEYYAKQLCRSHYGLNLRNGIPVLKKDFPKPQCRVENCSKIATSHKSELCKSHYIMNRNNIDLNRPKGNGGELNYQWKGGIFEYPNHYEMKKNRLIVLENANGICHYCGGKADRVHHRDKSKDNHSLKNLQASCASCNSQRQDKENRRYYIKRYGISSVEIMNTLELSKNEVNMMYDNGYLKNVLKLHGLLI